MPELVLYGIRLLGKLSTNESRISTLPTNESGSLCLVAGGADTLEAVV